MATGLTVTSPPPPSPRPTRSPGRSSAPLGPARQQLPQSRAQRQGRPPPALSSRHRCAPPQAAKELGC
eukprot:9505886-Lingulodinium_polyedra.AAC.1